MTFKLQLWSYDNADGGVSFINLTMFTVNSPPQGENSILVNEYKVKSRGQNLSTWLSRTNKTIYSVGFWVIGRNRWNWKSLDLKLSGFSTPQIPSLTAS